MIWWCWLVGRLNCAQILKTVLYRGGVAPRAVRPPSQPPSATVGCKPAMHFARPVGTSIFGNFAVSIPALASAIPAGLGRLVGHRRRPWHREANRDIFWMSRCRQPIPNTHYQCLHHALETYIRLDFTNGNETGTPPLRISNTTRVLYFTCRLHHEISRYFAWLVSKSDTHN